MELGNKPSFMGVYTGNQLHFPHGTPMDQPLILPRLGIPVWLVCDRDDRPERVVIEITLSPDDTLVWRNEIPLGPETFPQVLDPDSKKLSLHFQAVLFNLMLQPTGSLTVKVETETGVLRAGRVKVVVADQEGGTPSASPLTA